MTELTESERREMTSALIAADDDAYVRGHESASADEAVAAMAEVVERIIDARLAPIRALLDEGPDTWEGYDTRDIGPAFLKESVWEFTADLRAALSADLTAPQPTSGTEGRVEICGAPFRDSQTGKAFTCDLDRGHEGVSHAHFPQRTTTEETR